MTYKIPTGKYEIEERDGEQWAVFEEKTPHGLKRRLFPLEHVIQYTLAKRRKKTW